MGNNNSVAAPNDTAAANKSTTADHNRSTPKNFTLLHGCSTIEDHDTAIQHDILTIKTEGLKGEKGLRSLGFQFRFVPCCPAHIEEDNENYEHMICAEINKPPQSPHPQISKSTSVISLYSNNSEFNENLQSHHCHQCATRLFYLGRQEQVEQMNLIMITTANRKEFIADGAHYELISNLAQQAAHEKMSKAFDLQWVTVCDEANHGENHIKALVDKDHKLLLEEGENKWVLQELMQSNRDGKEKKEEGSCGVKEEDQKQQSSSSSIHKPTSINKTKATLLIATGRGKVRAGIFSRHHLLTAGIEVGSSWHCIREARLRHWGVAIIDPNARGEGLGYDSFKRSFSKLFVNEIDEEDRNAVENSTTKSSIPSSSSQTTLSASQSTQEHSIYILAHSASGGQLVRHLREDPSLLPSIRAVAFTDSTHNVQWCKHDPTLKDFLQANNCVYLRSNDVRSSQSCVNVSSRGKDIWCNCQTCIDNKKAAGMESETDSFWIHRFGKVKTMWAGTADHALTNWAAHSSIWDHFDDQESNVNDA